MHRAVYTPKEDTLVRHTSAGPTLLSLADFEALCKQKEKAKAEL